VVGDRSGCRERRVDAMRKDEAQQEGSRMLVGSDNF